MGGALRAIHATSGITVRRTGFVVWLGRGGVDVSIANALDGLNRASALVPAVLAPGCGRMDHRYALGAADVDQIADRRQRVARILAAGVAPALDRIEDRLRPVAAKL